MHPNRHQHDTITLTSSTSRELPTPNVYIHLTWTGSSIAPQHSLAPRHIQGAPSPKRLHHEPTIDRHVRHSSSLLPTTHPVPRHPPQPLSTPPFLLLLLLLQGRPLTSHLLSSLPFLQISLPFSFPSTLPTPHPPISFPTPPSLLSTTAPQQRGQGLGLGENV
ncbi:unnamed protein product [Closterium sp. NIES-54]